MILSQAARATLLRGNIFWIEMPAVAADRSAFRYLPAVILRLSWSVTTQQISFCRRALLCSVRPIGGIITRSALMDASAEIHMGARS
jgi:hypothetical protein